MDDSRKFIMAISPFRNNWKYINLTAVCAFIEGSWIVLAARIFLDVSSSESAYQVPEFPEKTFRVFRCSYPISELERLLREARLGIINIGDEQILFKRFEGNGLSIYENNFSFYGLSSSMFSDANLGHMDFPRCGLVDHAETIWNITQKVDLIGHSNTDELAQSLDKPYKDFMGLIKAALNIKPENDFTTGTSANLKIMALVKVRFSEKIYLSDGELGIVIEMDTVWSHEGISVAAKLTHKNGKVKTSLFDLSQFSVGAQEDNLERLVLVETVPDIWKAELFLRQHKVSLEIKECRDYSVLDGNPRLKVLKSFDINDAIFGENLKGKKLGNSDKDKTLGPRFESAVSLLLHVCGFNVANYGQIKGLHDGEIDILAYVPGSNEVLAIECTTENIDNKGKLGKLDSRVEKLRELLPNHNIHPVVATALFHEAAKNDIKIASERKIAVLTQEKLQELIQKAHHREGPIDIAKFILGRPDMPSLQDMIASGLLGTDE